MGPTRSMRSFDPVPLGRGECDAWVHDERLPQERLLLVESHTRLLDLGGARAQVQ